LEVEVEKAQHEVEYSTSGTRWRQMVTLTWYNYGNLIRLHALNESKKFLKRTDDVRIRQVYQIVYEVIK